MPSLTTRLVYSAVFLVFWVAFLAGRVMFKRLYNHCFNWGGSIKTREPEELPADIEESIALEIDSESDLGGEQLPRGWFQNWSVVARRSPKESKRIIQKVFQTNASRWELDISDTESEYLALPARMTLGLDREDLSRGIFTGDSSDHFYNIQRISQIKRPQLELAPVSPNYMSTEVLRPPGLLGIRVDSPKTVHTIGVRSRSSMNNASRGTQTPTTTAGSKYRPYPTSTVSSLSSATVRTPFNAPSVKSSGLHMHAGQEGVAPSLPAPSRGPANPDLCQSPNTTPPRLRRSLSCPPILRPAYTPMEAEVSAGSDTVQVCS